MTLQSGQSICKTRGRGLRLQVFSIAIYAERKGARWELGNLKFRISNLKSAISNNNPGLALLGSTVFGSMTAAAPDY